MIDSERSLQPDDLATLPKAEAPPEQGKHAKDATGAIKPEELELLLATNPSSVSEEEEKMTKTIELRKKDITTGPSPVVLTEDDQTTIDKLLINSY